MNALVACTPQETPMSRVVFRYGQAAAEDGPWIELISWEPRAYV